MTIPSNTASSAFPSSPNISPSPVTPDQGGSVRGSHPAAQVTLDDVQLHESHHWPPSYLAADFRFNKDTAIFGEVLDEVWLPESHGLMLVHVLLMSVAHFGFLPISLRAANHPSHHFIQAVLLAIAMSGWLASIMYHSASTNYYEGAVYRTLGNALITLSLVLTVVDSLGVIKRSIVTHRFRCLRWFCPDWSARNNWMVTAPKLRHERVNLDDHEAVCNPHAVFASSDDEGVHMAEAMELRSFLHIQPRSSSQNPLCFEGRLDRHGGKVYKAYPPALVDHRSTDAGGFAYIVMLTEITMYTGMCRGGLINRCIAHFAKGSIFFGYGILTFARYLGAYSDLGWAWNRRPENSRALTAEMVECGTIFLYGVTNTWMERFGVVIGSPYTVKQVQYISIAVMFWFAGLTVEPAILCLQFQSIPAIVIAVTGLAMAAHHQDYVFQVKIHSLWGLLLAGGSAFRLLTYFFLWLRPPTESTKPSRPPTEVLTSFGYTAGGIVLMLSVEEVSWAAMRAGYDDVMAFLNVTIAVTSLVFCWIVVVMAIKGYAVVRLQYKPHPQAS